MTKRLHWLVVAVGAAIGIVLLAAWPWLSKTADQRAAAAVLSGFTEAAIRPAFVDCPPEIYERFRQALHAVDGVAVKEPVTLIESVDDETVAKLVRDRADSAWSRVRHDGTVGGAVVLGLCDEDAVRLVAIDGNDGSILREASAPLVGRPSRGYAHLHVVSRPSGAEVYLDREMVGTTPLLLVNVRPGSHYLRLVHPLYQKEGEQVTLAADATAHYVHSLRPGQGRVTVVTHPPGAEIYLDGSRQAYTTPTVLGPMRSGQYQLELRNEPYRPLHATVAVPAGDTVRVNMAYPDAPPEQPRQPWRDPITGMEFVWVSGGCYEMGCGPWTNDCDPDEVTHEVCVDGFWIGRYEVTQEQWQRVMGHNPSTLNRAGNRPVNQVSWDDVQAFLKRLNAAGEGGFRLPTEAEWEFACRSGGKPEKFAGGYESEERKVGPDYLTRLAWVGEGWEPGPFPVGGKAANGLGLYDMSGNVWEWVEDTFVPYAYVQHAPKNPLQKEGGIERVVRGGSWFNLSRLARCSHRYRFDAGFRNVDLGFRLVRVTPELAAMNALAPFDADAP